MIWTASVPAKHRKELADNLEAAGKIVKEQMEEFFQWLDGRDIIPAYPGDQELMQWKI